MDQSPVLSVATSVFSDGSETNPVIPENDEVTLDRTLLAATDVDTKSESEIVFVFNGVSQVKIPSREMVPTDVVSLVREASGDRNTAIS